MKSKVCSFYGHRKIDITEELKQKAGANDMETAFINLIKESEVDKWKFY